MNHCAAGGKFGSYHIGICDITLTKNQDAESLKRFLLGSDMCDGTLACCY